MKQKKAVPVLWIGILSLALLIPQIVSHSLFIGSDWIFHANRFYDTSQQIANGNFQYFVSMYGFSASGRIINALYGPLFAYFNGLLLLIFHSWFSFQIVSGLIFNILTMSSMYYSLHKLKVNKLLSLLLTSIYVTNAYVQTWNLHQAFNSYGAIILPLGILSAINFFNDERTISDVLLLTFVVSLSIQIHMLTTLLLLLILCYFFIIAMFKVKQKKALLLSVTISAILSLFLTANIWGAMLEIYSENIIMRPFVNWDMDSMAISLSFDAPSAYFPLVMFILFLFLFVLIVLKNFSFETKILSIASFGFMFISTKIFPWNYLIQEFQGLTIFQFPSRFLMPAYALLFISIGMVLKECSNLNLKRIKNGSIFLLISCLGINVVNYYANQQDLVSIWKSAQVFQNTGNIEVKEVVSGNELRQVFSKDTSLKETLEIVQKPTSDSVPIKDKQAAFDPNFHPYGKYKETIINNELNEKSKKSVKDHHLVFEWNSDSSEEVTVPLFVYKRTEIIFNGQNIAQPKTNEIGALMLEPVKGENTIQLSYHSSPFFKFWLFLTFISWLVFAGSVCFIKFYPKKRRKKH